MIAIRFSVEMQSSNVHEIENGTYCISNTAELSALKVVSLFLHEKQREYEMTVGDLFEVFVNKQSFIPCYKDNHLCYIRFSVFNCTECSF